MATPTNPVRRALLVVMLEDFRATVCAISVPSDIHYHDAIRTIETLEDKIQSRGYEFKAQEQEVLKALLMIRTTLQRHPLSRDFHHIKGSLMQALNLINHVNSYVDLPSKLKRI